MKIDACKRDNSQWAMRPSLCLVTPRGFNNRLLRLSQIETMYTHLKSDKTNRFIRNIYGFRKVVNSMRQGNFQIRGFCNCVLTAKSPKDE